MVRIALLAFAAAVLALPQPQLRPDANGADKVGNGAALQFITGGCVSDADCASGCCAGLTGTPDAVCSGPAVSFAQGKTGCGFGGGAPPPPPPQEAAPVAAPVQGGLRPDANGADKVGNGAALQFITGGCLSDADCASGCCAGLTGTSDAVCSGPAVSFAQGKTGCGFGGGVAPPQEVAAPEAPAPVQGGGGEINAGLSGSQNVGLGNGAQFITGQCFSDADCASACCAGKEGAAIATCSATAVAFDSGKTGCGFVN